MARDRHGGDDLVMRLVAIARGLEDDFQYNTAKLYRAAAASLEYRKSIGRPRLGGPLEAAMAAANDELRAAGFEPDFIDLLERGHAAVVARGLPAIEEIPNLNVCRHCGRVMPGERPERCPNCRAWWMTFHRFTPSYLLEPLEPDTIVAALGSNLAEIERIVTNASDEDVDSGPWTLRQILVHFVVSQHVIGGWALEAIDEDQPVLGINEPALDDSSIHRMLDELRHARLAMIERVRGLRAEQWERPAWQPILGHFTARSLASYLVRHEQEHLAEFEARSIGE
jgi:hypothetical protein